MVSPLSVSSIESEISLYDNPFFNPLTVFVYTSSNVFFKFVTSSFLLNPPCPGIIIVLSSHNSSNVPKKSINPFIEPPLFKSTYG